VSLTEGGVTEFQNCLFNMAYIPLGKVIRASRHAASDNMKNAHKNTNTAPSEKS